jgi:hypothetical protein
VSLVIYLNLAASVTSQIKYFYAFTVVIILFDSKCIIFLLSTFVFSIVHAKFWPREITRKVLAVSDFEGLKTRQVRNLVVYSLIFITDFVSEDISEQSVKWHPEMTNGSFLLLQVQRLVHGIRLISGFSVVPVEKKLALAARRLFRTMCTDLIQYCGDQFATHMCHAFLHMVEDVIR